MSDAADQDTLRLDIWLWRARFFKTRALASLHVTKRGVRISRHNQVRRVDKPGATVMVGDVLIFTKARVVKTVEVAAMGERRGPASEAQGLYREVGDDSV